MVFKRTVNTVYILLYVFTVCVLLYVLEHVPAKTLLKISHRSLIILNPYFPLL